MRRAACLLLALGACHVIGGIESAGLECPVDGERNGRETDVDCGGPCAPCADYLACRSDADCANGVCGDDGTCLPPDCYDGRTNGSESDIDCGGDSELCTRCQGGERCREADDCAAAIVDPEGACHQGVCRSLCCYDDCEGCSDCPDVCPQPQSLGASCDVEDCADPFWCIEDEPDVYLCL